MNEKVPGPTQVTKCKIRRLNSGILRIFKLREWNLNLNSSDCRASKIICNDSNLDAIPWKLNIENPRFSICVSVWVGRNPPTNLSYGSKDAQENFISFDTNLMGVVRRRKKLYTKNRQKIYFTGVGSALGWAKI